MNLLHDPIPVLTRRIAVPASIGFLFNTLFNVVDTWYAGKVSTDALAALGLSFPAFFLVIAVSTGLSTGVSALMANAHGEGRAGQAHRYGAQAIAFGVFTSWVIGAVGIFGSRPFFAWMGAEGAPLELATVYMQIIFAGSIFFILNHVLNASLLAMGDTTTYRNVLILGVLLNLVFDPWFIFGGYGLPAMGFAGIGYSTVLIQAVSLLYMIHKVRAGGSMRGAKPADFRPAWRDLVDIQRQSLPATANMLTVGIGILVLTYFVNRFGPKAVAAYGIATRIEQIILLPGIGLNFSVLTLVGQNNGARKYRRVREAVWTALKDGAWLMTAGAILILLFARQAMGWFTNDPDVIRIGAEYLRIAAFVLYAYILLFVLTSALQGLKRPMYAIWMGLYRQLLAPVLLILLFEHYTSLGLYGIWWTVLITTWSAGLFTVWYVRRRLPSDETFSADSFANHAR